MENEKIPMVKDWFNSLDIDERVLCVSTIDSWITHEIKVMYSKQKKNTPKFKMHSYPPSQTMIDIQIKDKNKEEEKLKNVRKLQCVFNVCNSAAHKNTLEV